MSKIVDPSRKIVDPSPEELAAHRERLLKADHDFWITDPQELGGGALFLIVAGLRELLRSNMWKIQRFDGTVVDRPRMQARAKELHDELDRRLPPTKPQGT